MQFPSRASRESLGLTGEEVYSITEFVATVRIDTPAEAAYYRHGGILQYVLRQLLASKV